MSSLLYPDQDEDHNARAFHILIRHQGSRTRSSWKDPLGRTILPTLPDSAAAQLKALRDDIISGKATFSEVAARYSDGLSSRHGCDVGPFGRNKMHESFEDATYALKVGEISDIVDTDCGVHLIMRTG